MANIQLHRLTSRLLLLGEHCYLDSSDECYFANSYECSCQHGSRSLILSLKQGDPFAIYDAAQQLTSVIPAEWIRTCTFVPMPRSCGTWNALKDICRKLKVSDVRDLLEQKRDTPSSHSGWRPTPRERADLLRVNETQANPHPKTVVVVDDVLTTGSHFRAAKMVLQQRWPQMRVVGLFLTRVCSYRDIIFFRRDVPAVNSPRTDD